MVLSPSVLHSTHHNLIPTLTSSSPLPLALTKLLCFIPYFQLPLLCSPREVSKKSLAYIENTGIRQIIKELIC